MKLGEEQVRFTLPNISGLQSGDVYDVQFKAYSSSWDNRPVFRIIPLSVKVEILEHDKESGRIRLENGNVLNVRFQRKKSRLFSQILGDGNLCDSYLPLI